MAEKEKKNDEKTETKSYRVCLNPAKRFPLKKRAKRAMTFIRRFVTKHTRIPVESVLLSTEVNRSVWARGISNIPNKLDIDVLLAEEKARVFLKGGKELKTFIEEKKAAQKKKEEKEAEKRKAEAKETKEEKKEAEEKDKIEGQKLEEKKLKEKYGEALEIKRQ